MTIFVSAQNPYPFIGIVQLFAALTMRSDLRKHDGNSMERLPAVLGPASGKKNLEAHSERKRVGYLAFSGAWLRRHLLKDCVRQCYTVRPVTLSMPDSPLCKPPKGLRLALGSIITESVVWKEDPCAISHPLCPMGGGG